MILFDKNSSVNGFLSFYRLKSSRWWNVKMKMFCQKISFPLFLFLNFLKTNRIMILITVTLTGCFIAFTHHPLTRQRVSDSGLYMDVEWIRNAISWLWQVTGFIEIVPEKVNMDQSLSVMFPCWICNIKTCCMYCQSMLLPAAVTNKLQKAGLNRFYDAMQPRGGKWVSDSFACWHNKEFNSPGADDVNDAARSIWLANWSCKWHETTVQIVPFVKADHR